MPFKKGTSGNPGGRPKELAGIRELARENASLAIQTLVDVATNGRSESARVQASTALLDRGYGKPAQDLAVEDHRTVRQLSRDELMVIANGGVVYRDKAELLEGPVMDGEVIDETPVEA